MSQAKVDRYKEEKANRKKIIAQEKRRHTVSVICGWAIAAAVIGWAGYSGYHIYESKQPIETIYTDLDSINDYMQSLPEVE